MKKNWFSQQPWETQQNAKPQRGTVDGKTLQQEQQSVLREWEQQRNRLVL